jgi:hypothetical protein
VGNNKEIAMTSNTNNIATLDKTYVKTNIADATTSAMPSLS